MLTGIEVEYNVMLSDGAACSLIVLPIVKIYAHIYVSVRRFIFRPIMH